MEKQTNLLALLLLLCSFSPSLSSAASGDAAVMLAVAKSLVGVPSDWQSGPEPCSWYGIECTAGRITSIDLHSKGISGTLPDSLAQLSSLYNIDLGQNQISGPIPSLTGLSALQTVNLEENAFTFVPDNLFSSLTSLQSVTLDNNPLAPWSIPLDLDQCANLQSFSAAKASVTGGIPDIFGQLPNLTELKLSYNNLTGRLPYSFSGSNIQSLYLNDQQPPGLSGRIDVVGAMPHLQLVWLQTNSFTGSIPDLSNLTSLTSFNIRDNRLTGPVPPSLTSNPTLKDALLSNNRLQGPFPNFSGSVTVDPSNGNQFCNPGPGPCDPRVTALLSVAGGFGYPLDLANSWKGNNPCSNKSTGVGGITCDGMGKDIMVLDFSGRNYAGTISPDIANLTLLTKIILSDNQLTGPIPDSLTKLPELQLLDVTNNSLTGKIPDFSPSVVLKASGNPLLGRDSSPGPSGDGRSGSPSGGTPASSSAGNSSGVSSSSHAAIIGCIIPGVLVLVCCSACLIYYQRRKNCIQIFGRFQIQSSPSKQETKVNMASNAHGGATSDLYSVGSSGNAHMNEAQITNFSFQALQKATNDFSEANISGRGRFSVVYKGEHNGTLIAVKRNVSDIIGNKATEEFRAEIDVLKKVRHRHLVGLIGYCVNGKEKFLVYEYMPEGTLEQHLFNRNDNGYSALSWKQRLTIALDVARGIEYLHGLAQESFIHRDLKPSNILLDKDTRAKVSNFGLVKLVDSEKSMSTRLAGTFGYLAPEYVNTGKISTKVDVYAFGVILIELITGRKALNESLYDEESHLVTCLRRSMLNKEKFMNYVDATLDLDEEACSNMTDVAELAHHCTAREPNQRPDMGHTVNMLVPLVEKWNPGSCHDEDNYDNSSMSLNQRLLKWQLDDGTSTMDLLSSYKGSQSSKNDE